ncbi:hypothetical protein DPMN_130624 [Dreissena polymorpha]|uniref:2-phosphoxylose phosphatase 1 n=1 Tax=Dreissena polymorpha TaxID=45954 RepID=A0A9D4H723_DREPO|nr:hypothetical protein DPMN_130624 [Dreissena polymorpha]
MPSLKRCTRQFYVLAIFVLKIWREGTTTSSNLPRSLLTKLPPQNFSLSDTTLLTRKLDQMTKQRAIAYNYAVETRIQEKEDFLSKYCNSPFVRTTGSEGSLPVGFTLRLVHVFTRHGDRTSMHKLHGTNTQNYSCSFPQWYKDSDDVAKYFPYSMTRLAGKHSVEGHFRNWALYPDKPVCSDSELTSRGALQHINLGKHLNDRYIKRHSLIDANETFEEKLILKSTGYSRTYQSATALIYGLLSQFDLSKIRIEHSRSLLFCSESQHSNLKCKCPRASDYKERISRISSNISSNRKQNTALRRKVASALGLDRSAIPWLSAIFDALTPAFCHGLREPFHCGGDTSNTECIDYSLINALFKEVSQQEKIRIRDPENENVDLKYALLSTYPVLLEVLRRVQLISKDLIYDGPKFVIYSGHDVTLTPLLVALGIYDNKWPPYASRLVIEAVTRDSDGGVFLRFVYNGKDKTDRVSFCKDIVAKRLCPLKAIVEFVSADMLGQFNTTGYEQACRY